MTGQDPIEYWFSPLDSRAFRDDIFAVSSLKTGQFELLQCRFNPDLSRRFVHCGHCQLFELSRDE